MLQGIWLDIARALALVMVIEGIGPFVAPSRWRETMTRMGALDDKVLRVVGLMSMLGGLLVLQLL